MVITLSVLDLPNGLHVPAYSRLGIALILHMTSKVLSVGSGPRERRRERQVTSVDNMDKAAGTDFGYAS